MGILGGLFGGIYLASSGGSKKQVQTPPINAGSKDEEKFIQYASPSQLLSLRDLDYLLSIYLILRSIVGNIDLTRVLRIGTSSRASKANKKPATKPFLFRDETVL